MKFRRKTKKDDAADDRPLGARQLVQAWEELTANVESAQERFQRGYPEAYAELQAIDALESRCRALRKECSARVLEERESAGPFRFIQGWRKPGYDDGELLKVLVASANADLLTDLVSRGLITGLTLNADVGQLLHARQDPSVARIERAWVDERTPLTPYVRGPK